MFVLYHKSTRPTGRVIAQGLDAHSGETPLYPFSTLIRWGNAQHGEIDAGIDRVLNPARAIWKAGDKLATLSILREADIRVPEFQTAPFQDGGIYLARRRRGFGGKDIVVCSQPGQYVERAEWYSRYIDNDREYRLHVVGDAVVRVQRKYLERPGQRMVEQIKNHKNGYVFKAPQRGLRPERLSIAVRSVQALGLTFGAVDAVVDREGTMYVLEVNTAPACAPLTAQAYITAFRNLTEGL